MEWEWNWEIAACDTLWIVNKLVPQLCGVIAQSKLRQLYKTIIYCFCETELIERVYSLWTTIECTRHSSSQSSGQYKTGFYFSKIIFFSRFISWCSPVDSNVIKYKFNLIDVRCGPRFRVWNWLNRRDGRWLKRRLKTFETVLLITHPWSMSITSSKSY